MIVKKFICKIVFVSSLILSFTLNAQTDTTLKETDDFDFSEFDGDFDVAPSDGKSKSTKVYCNQKVSGLSPAKLISIGYDYQGPFNLNSSLSFNNINEPITRDERFNSNHGYRVSANFPVISKYNFILNVGFNHWQSVYEKDRKGITVVPQNIAAFNEHLAENPLRTTGVNFTIFKPLNEVNYIIAQGQADLNGNYLNGISPDFGLIKYSGALLYGWKKNDRTSYAVGFTRTYRGGEVLHIPIVLYNKTFNSKWGVELLLPARGHVRRTINPRSMFFFGYELEGNSYNIRGVNFGSQAPANNYDQMELRKSEIRARVVYETSVSGFIWLSVQAGARIMYKFNVAENDRAGYGNFLIENQVSTPFYVNVSINLVSP
jgi:hypothetical protein